jgi:hypothetical protein
MNHPVAEAAISAPAARRKSEQKENGVSRESSNYFHQPLRSTGDIGQPLF